MNILNTRHPIVNDFLMNQLNVLGEQNSLEIVRASFIRLHFDD
jgi:hypothetical protein